MRRVSSSELLKVMVKQRSKLIGALLEEHLDELEFLWAQRRGALRSPRYSPHELCELEERIEAHVQGVLVGGAAGVPFCAERLAAEDTDAVFAAAYALLRLNDAPAAERVVNAFLEAECNRLDGLCAALCHGPIHAVRDRLRSSLTSAPPAVALAAAAVLTFQGGADLPVGFLNPYLEHAKAELRRSAWRIAGRLKVPRLPAEYQKALGDEDEAVRREAFEAAAWARQQWLPGHCRQLLHKPAPAAGAGRWLLAVLGTPHDLPALVDLAGNAALGPTRFAVLGAFGHPGVVEALLPEIAGQEPRSAVAAAAAFTKITNCRIDSEQRVTLPPDDGSTADELEQEFLEEVFLPDPELARQHWSQLRERFSHGTRWCRGFDLSQGTPAEVLAQLDLESRWEACLRGKFEETWTGTRVDLERFPWK